MAAVHYTTIPFEPNTANKNYVCKKIHIYAKFFPVLTALCKLGMKFLELFCAFLRAAFLGFSCANNYG